jgi:hypothetical protein
VRPWQLGPLSRKFRPDSSIQTFRSLDEFDRFYPHYMPYGRDDAARYRARAKPGQRFLHKATAAVLGNRAYTVAPNLASVWVRR